MDNQSQFFYSSIFKISISPKNYHFSSLDWAFKLICEKSGVTDEASGNGEFNITSNTFSVFAPTTFTFNYDYLNRLITEVEPKTPDDAPLGNQAQARIDFTIIVNRLFVPQLGINSPRAAVFSSNPDSALQKVALNTTSLGFNN